MEVTTMTKKFIEKVLYLCIVDTKKYRYVANWDNEGNPIISRLPIEYLDTTAALDGWEVCYHPATK
jgi:hypothetical protein